MKRCIYVRMEHQQDEKMDSVQDGIEVGHGLPHLTCNVSDGADMKAINREMALDGNY